MTALLSSPATITVFAPAAPGTSPLETRAMNMAVGTYAEVTGMTGTSFMIDSNPGGAGHFLNYVKKLTWDPQGKKIIIGSSDDPGMGRTTAIYDVATNAWSELTNDPWPAGAGVNHGYDLNAIDKVRRRYWTADGVGGNLSGYVHAYDIGTNVWTRVATGGWGYAVAPAMEFFPDRDVLLFLYDGRLYSRPPTTTGGWTLLTSSLRTSYHQKMKYNATHKCVVFGGGNDTPRNLYKMDINGTITQYAAAPIDITCPRIEFVEDPSTGNFVVYGYSVGTKSKYSFDPVSGAWTSLSTLGVPDAVFSVGPYPSILLMAACVMPEYRVQAFFSHPDSSGDFRMYLYKYAA